MNTIFYLQMAPAELVRLGISVAWDCLINEVKQIYEKQQNKQTPLAVETSVMRIYTLGD